MTLTEMARTVIESNTGMLKMHLADLSDADLMVRPVPAANHAAWQLAHLAYFEVMVAKMLSPDAAIPAPPTLESAQSKEAPGSDDPARFPTKAETMGVIESARKVQREALAKMSDSDLDAPSPEAFRKFAPTLAHLIFLCPDHACMHIGQIQVLRRKLGKPRVF